MPASKHKPQISLQLVNFSAKDPGNWQHMFDRALAAEDAGVDRVVVSDHVVMGEHLEAYGSAKTGGTEGGKQPTGPDGHWLEPLTVLSMVAAQTRNVRLCTGILLVALRTPVVLAKQLATLDVLSNGRLDIGVGVGWQREEYEAAGLSYEGRGRLLDHAMEVLQAFWQETPASYASPELEFKNIYCVPKPRQAGGVPLWVSGTVNDKVVDRLARFGAGWIPWGPAQKEPINGVDEMRAALAKRGRDLADLQVQGTLPIARDGDGKPDLDKVFATLPSYVEAGVTDFRIWMNVPAARGEATNVLGELVTRFRATVG